MKPTYILIPLSDIFIIIQSMDVIYKVANVINFFQMKKKYYEIVFLHLPKKILSNVSK